MFEEADQSRLDDIRIRQKTYESILNLLDEAGYYRVRLKALSEFDKVVGGLCWAITASHQQVDVNLFFQENLSVGRRIRLAENIVSTLRLMKCPHPLQAHQIQGGDYPALQPIIVWLTELVALTRQDTSNLVRPYTELIFHKEFSGKEARQGENEFFSVLRKRYQPVRKFRISKKQSSTAGLLSTEEARVRAVLLEFGEKVSDKGTRLFDYDAAAPTTDQTRDDPPKQQKSSLGDESFEKQYRAMQRQAQRNGQERAERAKAIEEELLGHVVKEEESSTGKSTKPQMLRSPSAPRGLLKSAPARPAHRPKKKRTKQSHQQPTTKAGKLAAQARLLRTIKKEISIVESQIGEESQVKVESNERANALEEKIKAEKQKIKRANREIAKLEEMENHACEHEEDLNVLKNLVERNEMLKLQEKKFKANCKVQLKQLQGEIEALKKLDEEESEYTQRLAEIDKLHDEVSKKHQEWLDMFASCNRKVASLSRIIDDVPTRSELIQYERRFIELYEQLATKLDENRRHVTTYNTLETTFELLEKEVSLLQSINDTFKSSMKSKRGKGQFLEQCQGIVTGLNSRLEQMKGKQETAIGERDAMELEYQKLVEQQRRYFQAVKDFQMECDLNQELMSQQVEI